MTALIMVIAVVAGMIQGVTDFGLGIILLCFFPYLFMLNKSAAFTNAITLCLAGIMCYQYRKSLGLSLIILPTVFYLMGSSLSIYLAPMLPIIPLKIGFAIFLILLSIYFLGYSSKVNIKATVLTMFICGFLSGICDGLFAIGGPMMVLFYLAVTSTQESYMASIQATFFITGLYNLILRIHSGLLTVKMLPLVCGGIIAISLGLLLGNLLIKRLNVKLVRLATYLLIGCSGLLTLLTTIF